MGAELIVTHTEMTKGKMSFVADKMFYHGDQSILKHQILSHTNANHLCAVKNAKIHSHENQWILKSKISYANAH